MGIQQSKKLKQKEKYLFNKDKEDTDFNHGKANDLTGNPNIASTTEGLGPTQHINNQMEPSNRNEAMPTRIHQVSAADATENREQTIHKAMNSSQNANPVKHVPYHPSSVRVTQQHTCAAKTTDIKTSTSKPVLQQARTAGQKKNTGKFDALSDILEQVQDVSEKRSQQQLRPPTQMTQKTKPTAPVQQQENRQVIYGHTQSEETTNFTPSQQKPAAKDTTELTLQTARAAADTVHSFEVSAPVQVPAQVLWKECREVAKPAGSLHIKETEAQVKAKLTKSPSQKSNCGPSNLNEVSTNLTSHATDKAHNIAQQSTSTKPGIAEMPAAKPTGSADHSTQISNQPKTQVNNKENTQQKPCLNHNSVTNVISVDYRYCFSSKSERSRANAAKMRLRQKLANKLKAQRRNGSKSTQQTAEDPVTTVPKSSQQQGCTAMEENTVKKHSEAHVIPQPNKADDGNTSSCIQTDNMKTETPYVSIVEGMPKGAPNYGDTHYPTTAPADTNVKLKIQCEPKTSLSQDTAVKPKKKCIPKDLHQKQPKNTGNITTKEEINGKNGQVEQEKLKQAITPPVTPEHEVCAKGCWHQFTVNQSCSHKARCQHNPRKGLPLNIKKWSDECPKCEPPWVTTTRLAACLALREMQDESGDSQE